jgi:hypothetical protein
MQSSPCSENLKRKLRRGRQEFQRSAGYAHRLCSGCGEECHMRIETIWAELEQDLAWRHAELRLLSNTMSSLRREDERDRFRRAQLVMLYAHVEGFCKVAFLIYIKAINQSRTPMSSISDELVASAFSRVAIWEPERQSVFFKKASRRPKVTCHRKASGLHRRI